MKTAIFCAGLILLSQSSIPAQPLARLYAVTFYDRNLITIDTNSGAGTLITNLPASPIDIAATGGKLWFLAGGTGVDRLFDIDPWTGAVREQKSFVTSLGGGEGAMDFAADGTALAIKVQQSTGTLFRIDMALPNVVPISDEGGVNPGMDGLAFDTNGVLYGLSQNAGGFGLYVVKTNSGTTTLVGSLGITFPGTGGAVAGLTFAPDGTLFAAAGNPTESRLYRVNKLTGVATLIGSVGFAGVSGIRFFVPPPGPLAVSRMADSLRLSWPHVRGGRLETATTVTGTWTSAMFPVATNGPEAVVLAPTNDEVRFFRLAQ